MKDGSARVYPGRPAIPDPDARNKPGRYRARSSTCTRSVSIAFTGAGT